MPTRQHTRISTDESSLLRSEHASVLELRDLLRRGLEPTLENLAVVLAPVRGAAPNAALRIRESVR
jgi:hypothetical protein